MSQAASLRTRLLVVILTPIVVISVCAWVWQLQTARQTAQDVFNKSLLVAALAVANDVAISGGDALSFRTRDLLASASGGPVFYHVYAPDGVIVAGYATPPVGIDRTGQEAREPTFFAATYLGRDVSGVRVQTQTELDGLPGLYTTTVWQEQAARAAFVRQLVLQSLSVSSIILLSLALAVRFGVRWGLRPLLNLEDAIARRSGTDLAPIRRAVPQEVSGIVATLNRLFGQVSTSMQSQSEFIANAAHQLRNPIAGVLALAEAVVAAKGPTQTKDRATDLLRAAQDTAELSSKLLILERAQALSHAGTFEDIELGAALREWLAGTPIKDHARDIATVIRTDNKPIYVHADPVMLREAVVNLIDNAVAHGGPGLTQISVALSESGGQVSLRVADNGRGIPEDALEHARLRFVQLGETGASGLGLSIVDAILSAHGGHVSLAPGAPGLIATLHLSSAARQMA